MRVEEGLLNNTTHLIKIEDNLDGSESEEASGEEPGFLGFFRKTFSSVKKTFEQTFNGRAPRDAARAETQQRRQPAVSTHVNRREALTPDLLQPIQEKEPESPR